MQDTGDPDSSFLLGNQFHIASLLVVSLACPKQILFGYYSCESWTLGKPQIVKNAKNVFLIVTYVWPSILKVIFHHIFLVTLNAGHIFHI